MKHVPFAGLVLLLSACGAVDSARRLVEPSADLRVQEVARSQHCSSVGDDSRVTLFRDVDALKAWETGRVSLSDGRNLADAPHVLIEMGQRKTGGYGLAVSRAARLSSSGRLTLTATYVEPSSAAFVTQALTAPCVLVRLPKHEYTSAEVLDQSGRQRADSNDTATVPAPVVEPPMTEPSVTENDAKTSETESSWWPF